MKRLQPPPYKVGDRVRLKAAFVSARPKRSLAVGAAGKVAGLTTKGRILVKFDLAATGGEKTGPLPIPTNVLEREPTP